LLVRPDGAKYWRFNYQFNSKLLACEPPVDPSLQKKADRRAAILRSENTFKNIALEWWENKQGAWSARHTKAILARLTKDFFPILGARPIAEIEAPELLDVLRIIERRGALEIASKGLVICGQVFRYAIATGRAKRDVARDLRGALKTREVNHHPKLSENELPEFLHKLNNYDGNVLTRLALQLLVLTWVRTGELRASRWAEFDSAKREWRIPADRMKMGAEHIVPLSAQAIGVIDEIRTLSGHRDHLFPNEHHPQKFMSENTILFALYRMGYRGRATGHGFRGTASTIMNEYGWNRDAIERQLAHGEKDAVRAAYNSAQYLPERREMLQAWADYLDELAAGREATPAKRHG
jgi:integrase